MAINFPTSIDVIQNPVATDPQNNPSHSAQHWTANDILEALEAKVGINSSSDVTSLDYKINNIAGGVSEALILAYSVSL